MSIAATDQPKESASKLLSAAEFDQLAADTDDRMELVAGEIQRMAPPNHEHGKISGNSYAKLTWWLNKDGLGEAYVEAGYRLRRDPDTVRIPDVSVLLEEKLAALGDGRRYPDFAPDLAIEVLSPSDTFEAVERKALEYMEAGSALVWIINPSSRSIHAYSEQGKRVERFNESDTLHAGDLLPGFALPVSELFPKPAPKAEKPSGDGQ